MPDSDVKQAIQEKLSNAIGRATGGLSEEFENRLRKLRGELEELVRTSIAAIPVAETPAPTADGEAAAAGARTLLNAAESIDRTRSQTQVLAALLEGADILASRAAVLLTRPDGIQGWGTVGFEEAGPQIEEVHLPYTEGSPWGEMANARGAVTLSQKEAAPLCDALGTGRPQEAILIPIALADRTAAALYADRQHGDEAFDTSGLQILATLAGLTLETLPLRRRGATPSLRLAEEASGEAGLPPWNPQEVTSDEPPAPAATPDEDEAPAEEPIASEAVGFAVEEDPGATHVERQAVEAAADAADRETADAAAKKAEDGDSAAAVESKTSSPEEKSPAKEAAEPAAPVDAEAPKDKDATADAATPKDKDATDDADRAPAAPKRRARPARAGSLEVKPPAEIRGPGSAFSEQPADSTDQAGHQDARRLARLLVSEIKLYNEEKLEEGRSSGNIVAVLGDEIEQSRQAYEQRVEADIRKSSDYFQEELVRILAKGNQATLGG